MNRQLAEESYREHRNAASKRSRLKHSVKNARRQRVKYTATQDLIRNHPKEFGALLAIAEDLEP